MAIVPLQGTSSPAYPPTAARPAAPLPAPTDPADRFTPSENNERVVSQKDMLALKARPAFTDQDLMAAIGRHDYNLVEKMQGMPDKRAFVSDFHKNHKAEYDSLVADIRAGKVDSPSLKVAVALETLKGTQWAAKGEGAKVMRHLEGLYDSGRLSSDEDPGGLGRTDQTTEGATGRDGSKSETRVLVRHDLLDSPESVAAVLAHEGQHSYRASIGQQKRSLHEEVDAHMAQNAVWSEFGAEKYASHAQAQGGSLDKTAAFDTPEKLYNHLASTYVQDDLAKGDRAAARGIVIDYMDYAQHHDFAPLHHIGDDDLAQLTRDAQGLVGKNSSNAFLSAVDNLQNEAENRKTSAD